MTDFISTTITLMYRSPRNRSTGYVTVCAGRFYSSAAVLKEIIVIGSHTFAINRICKSYDESMTMTGAGLLLGILCQSAGHAGDCEGFKFLAKGGREMCSSLERGRRVQGVSGGVVAHACSLSWGYYNFTFSVPGNLKDRMSAGCSSSHPASCELPLIPTPMDQRKISPLKKMAVVCPKNNPAV